MEKVQCPDLFGLKKSFTQRKREFLRIVGECDLHFFVRITAFRTCGHFELDEMDEVQWNVVMDACRAVLLEAKMQRDLFQ